MDFFETADDVEQQLADVRRQLDLLHGDVSRPIALSRLKDSSPFHPILLLRALFMIAVVLTLTVALLAFLVPFMAGVLDPKLISTIRKIEMAMGGTPLPIAFAGGSGLLVIAWFAVDRAAVAFGRGANLLPAEARERDRLNSEITRLTRQVDLINRANNTPRPSAVRYRVPTDAPLPSHYAMPEPAPSYLAPPSLPPQLNTRPDHTPSPSPRRADDGYARFRTPATNGREVVPIPRPTTISLTPSESLHSPGIEGPTDQNAPTAPSASKVFDTSSYVVDDERDQPTATTHRPDVQYVVDTVSQQGAFDRPVASDVPALARVNEEWLQDAITKATVLARSFPMQARLEFSQDEHLPFTLVLERATPAMAVRAMMAYVEFMSTIATPRRGRIELVSVAHLDRTFHRNVRAACTPYFEQEVHIKNEPGRIELAFDGADARWDRYPRLPVSP